ncbi:MAG: YbhB/YbcL family Raf kinase inhibitor-like protein [Chloroflexi bacterium]|nr:YbhB/YbcL family Raf kinase inhibitor-like protein [Chloroflexota bacterium]OJW05420.1 MAG: hypothetical protein BGO39_33960 [Chloroflexi bacterium 54-19]
MSISVNSSQFGEGQTIPAKYTCQGENISPPLAWNGLPENTQSLVLIMDDPDAPVGTWVHWVLYNLSPALTGLPEGVATGGKEVADTQQGLNSWKKPGYGGPCPPNGTHRYFFRLYALDVMLNLKAAPTKQQILKAMQNHVLDQGELMGTYRKR